MHEEESLVLLGEIKGELASLRELVEHKINDHEARIRGMEHKWWSGTGAFGIILTVMGSILYKLHVTL